MLIAHLLDALLLLVELGLHAQHLVFLAFIVASEESHNLLTDIYWVHTFVLHKALYGWPDVSLLVHLSILPDLCQVLVGMHAATGMMSLLELGHLLEFSVLVLCLRQVKLVVALECVINLSFAAILRLPLALRHERFRYLNVNLLATFIHSDALPTVPICVELKYLMLRRCLLYGDWISAM